MATIQEMLRIAGSIENAEKMARNFIETQGPHFLLDLQLLLSIQGRFDEALEVNNQALEHNPEDVRAQFDRGWHYMRDGELFKGFTYMDKGRWQELWGNRHIGTQQPIWSTEQDAEDKYILYYTEAGFGDELVFARFVKEVAEKSKAKITVSCSEGLLPIYSRVAGTSAVVDRRVALATYHDFWIPSMSVPIILGTEYEDLSDEPYLTADDSMVDKYREVLKGDKLRVGIRWRGNPEFEHEQFRIFPEQLLFDAVDQKHIKAYSLQRDLNYRPPEPIVDMEPFLETWEDTAAIIANMDLVISSCTAIAHLAGGMGIPTWVVTPILPYWTWALPGEQSPHYSCVRIFRQEKFGEWEKPFEKIKTELGRMKQ